MSILVTSTHRKHTYMSNPQACLQHIYDNEITARNIISILMYMITIVEWRNTGERAGYGNTFPRSWPLPHEEELSRVCTARYLNVHSRVPAAQEVI